jgi:hypothetical protein
MLDGGPYPMSIEDFISLQRIEELMLFDHLQMVVG